MPDEVDMVELSQYMNREQAELARERLLEAGIQSSIPDDLLYNIHAGISATSGGVRLMVEPKDLDEAKQILEKSVDEYPLPADFDPAGPAEETPIEVQKAGFPYGSAFIIGGFAALVILGLWTAFAAPAAITALGLVLWNVFLTFLVGGLIGLVIRVCSRVLLRNGLGRDKQDKGVP